MSFCLSPRDEEIYVPLTALAVLIVERRLYRMEAIAVGPEKGTAPAERMRGRHGLE